jgi:hypothetical protein
VLLLQLRVLLLLVLCLRVAALLLVLLRLLLLLHILHLRTQATHEHRRAGSGGPTSKRLAALQGSRQSLQHDAPAQPAGAPALARRARGARTRSPQRAGCARRPAGRPSARGRGLSEAVHAGGAGKSVGGLGSLEMPNLAGAPGRQGARPAPRRGRAMTCIWSAWCWPYGSICGCWGCCSVPTRLSGDSSMWNPRRSRPYLPQHRRGKTPRSAERRTSGNAGAARRRCSQSSERGFGADTACPIRTGRGTRRVQSVRGRTA